MPEAECDLTDHEGLVLAVILRQQPITAYEIAKIHEQSPTSSFNTSKGKLYPLIRRLQERGLVAAEPVEGDARRTERLVCTEEGRDMVRSWVKQVRPRHLLVEDPLRTKVLSFNLLSRDEQIEWIVDAKALLAGKLRDLEAREAAPEFPYAELANDNARSSVRARLEWLDGVLQQVVRPAAS